MSDRGRANRVPTAAAVLGVAGLLPLLLALFVRLMAGGNPESQLPGMAGALALITSALILSFLGGIWWGVAVARVPMEEQAPLFALAVVPSILALLLVGLSLRWPMIASTLLGLVIMATPLVDRALRARACQHLDSCTSIAIEDGRAPFYLKQDRVVAYVCGCSKE